MEVLKLLMKKIFLIPQNNTLTEALVHVHRLSYNGLHGLKDPRKT